MTTEINDNETNSLDINVEEKRITVCTIDGQEYNILHKFTVIHPGWECDFDGYIIEYEGKNRLLLSNHGSFEMIDQSIRPYDRGTSQLIEKPRDQVNLLYKIRYLNEYIQETRKALQLLEYDKLLKVK